MLKQGSFINNKFNMLLLGTIWGTLAYCINMMTDSLISGSQLGEISLQAVSIVFPLFSVIYFFAYLVAPGASVLFGKQIGEFKQEEAYRTAGTSFFSSILLGIVLAVVLWLIKEPFLSYYNCSGQLYCDASTYYNWLLLFAVIFPIQGVLYYLDITDGEAVLISAANIADISANIVLSIVLSRTYGINGLCIATCVGLVLRIILYSAHFLKSSNNVKLRFCLDIGIAVKSIALSLSVSLYFLFLAIVDVVMNKIIIISCGMAYIPAYSVVNLVFGICEVFQALNDASVGLITCFYGERNNQDLRLIFRKITYSILFMSAGITVFFFLCAPLMPVIYGLETSETINAAVFASRVCAFSALGFGASFMTTALSCSVEKPMQACFVSFLNDVFSPLLLSILLGSLWGFKGIAIGMCLSTYFAFGIYALARIPRKGKNGFPIYVEDFGNEGLSYDLKVTKDSVIELRNAVSQELSARGYAIRNIDLLIEELFTRMMEKNPGKSVLAECTLLFSSDEMRIIIRDNGKLFNFVDENNHVESLNAHVLNSLLEHTNNKNYLLTASFNRNGFVYYKQQDPI